MCFKRRRCSITPLRPIFPVILWQASSSLVCIASVSEQGRGVNASPLLWFMSFLALSGKWVNGASNAIPSNWCDIQTRFCRFHSPQSVFDPVRLWLYTFSLGTPSGMVTSYSSGGGFPSSLGTYASIYFPFSFWFSNPTWMRSSFWRTGTFPVLSELAGLSCWNHPNHLSWLDMQDS